MLAVFFLVEYSAVLSFFFAGLTASFQQFLFYLVYGMNKKLRFKADGILLYCIHAKTVRFACHMVLLNR